MSVLEEAVENALVKAVKAAGGVAYKFVSPARRNVPDRLIDLPNLPLFFVECKAPGEEPTAAQAREHKRLRERGKVVFVIDRMFLARDLVMSVVARRDLNHWEGPL